MTEYETAMLALREREVLAHESLARTGVGLSSSERRTDEDLWALYASARGCSNYCRTDAEAASFANDMLKRHRALFPK